MFDTLKVIHGLVTRGSSTRRHVSPHRRAGLTKLRVSVVAAPKWQPSLSPFTYEGFCLGGRFVMVRCWKRPAGLEKHSLAKGEGISKGGTLARFKGCNCGRRVIRPMLESRPATITKRLQSRITPQSGLANGPGLGRTQETPCLARDHPGFNRPSQTERKADIQHPARGDIQTRKGYDSAGLGN